MGRISNLRHLHCFFDFTLLTKQPTSHSHNNAVIITTQVLRHSISSPARQAIRKVRSCRRRSRKRRGQSIPRIRNPSKPQQLAGRFISFFAVHRRASSSLTDTWNWENKKPLADAITCHSPAAIPVLKGWHFSMPSHVIVSVAKRRATGLSPLQTFDASSWRAVAAESKDRLPSAFESRAT